MSKAFLRNVNLPGAYKCSLCGKNVMFGFGFGVFSVRIVVYNTTILRNSFRGISRFYTYDYIGQKVFC